MEHFVVSARKYRPQNFEDVVGQKAISNTLLNAIKNNHLAQALLFTGPRGVGKTSCARILAKTINEREDDSPSEDKDYSFNIFELDAASNNSVEDIRNLTDQVRIPPQTGKYKVYIIDEVHMLSQSAFNAFLKTLEEPPKHAIFILATTEKHKIIPTILSRCQIFDFKRITVTDIKEHLKEIAIKEGVNAEDDALHIIAQKADGAMRDALSTYDRVVSYCGTELTRQAVAENLNVLDYETFFKVTDLILENRIADLLMTFNHVLSKGFDGQHFISGLASHFRDLMVCQNQNTIKLLEVGELIKSKYFEQSERVSQSFLLEALELTNNCDFDYKLSRNQRLHVEISLMQLASITAQNGENLQKKKLDTKIITPQEAERNNTKEESKDYPKTKEEQNSDLKSSTLVSENKPETIQQKSENKTSEKTEVEKEQKSQVKDEVLADSEIKQPENKEPTKSNPPARKPDKPSGLSLKGLRHKKELKAEQERLKSEVEHKDNDFSQEELENAWTAYRDQLEANGLKILASTIGMCSPKIDGQQIKIEVANDTMRVEIMQSQGELMAFLKEKLQNTYIELHIDINHNEVEKTKYVYTDKEKYNKLKEINPAIDNLRQKLDLDFS
ncbi:DNA polymerase III, subunit gamma and tau [Psychroflexus sp. S27]|uniref:DNA polymerase III subunit gamma/tau n=1 Tax=Psychroflexus sp. S27 TaxID=1982757 RepID=UPI000C299D80|nr:DNA polymerase III subunit gamma/tau [Psychroflexus sp. S27]PJX24013.1 DNA polymerase III, subunit gamma and tau [Psychroflexus sp. S27]